MSATYSHDSLNEGKVADLLKQAGLRFESQVSMPVSEWPWKTERSRGAPKCDFYLPEAGIYIEVKGWMTLFGLAKSAWLTQQTFPYYFFQNDDETWDPFTGSPVPGTIDQESKAAFLRCSRLQQVEELRYFTRHQGKGCSSISRARIRRHIEGRIETFKAWTGSFP